MVINEDELIEFELKRMLAFISLILVVFYFLIKSLFKTTGFLIEKKILKLNESKNIVYENIDKASENPKNNINSVKSGILELSSFFGIILIIILISPNN